MSSIPDPIAAVSSSISAYMSGHESANLAYVKYFGKKTDAVSATFKSLNSKGFVVTYKVADGSEHEVFIEFISPVTKREDVRLVLEEMAKEAEAALGMPSSLNGPPPFKALMKAAEIEDAQKSEIKNLHEDHDAETSAAIANAAIGDILGSNNGKPKVQRDIFYPVDLFTQSAVAIGLSSLGVLTYVSDTFLQAHAPFILSFRNYLGPKLIRTIFNWAIYVHIIEGLAALTICLKRNWYSPLNVVKWTGSTLLFGYGSMTRLLNHGKLVSKASQKED